MDSTVGFANRVAVIRCSSEIRIGKRDATVRPVAQNVARCGLAVQAKEEAWLWIHVRVASAIQDDAGDVAARIEPARSEHVGHLLS